MRFQNKLNFQTDSRLSHCLYRQKGYLSGRSSLLTQYFQLRRLLFQLLSLSEVGSVRVDWLRHFTRAYEADSRAIFCDRCHLDRGCPYFIYHAPYTTSKTLHLYLHYWVAVFIIFYNQPTLRKIDRSITTYVDRHLR